eukprot:gene18281-biopygen18955
MDSVCPAAAALPWTPSVQQQQPSHGLRLSSSSSPPMDSVCPQQLLHGLRLSTSGTLWTSSDRSSGCMDSGAVLRTASVRSSGCVGLVSAAGFHFGAMFVKQTD